MKNRNLNHTLTLLIAGFLCVLCGALGGTVRAAEPIHLLPSLPADWPTGSVRGIQARDGFVVDINWEKGQLTRAVIHSTWGKSCKARYGHKTASFDLKPGGGVVLNKNVGVIQ